MIQIEMQKGLGNSSSMFLLWYICYIDLGCIQIPTLGCALDYLPKCSSEDPKCACRVIHPMGLSKCKNVNPGTGSNLHQNIFVCLQIKWRHKDSETNICNT